MANEKRLIDANTLSDKVDESKRNNPHPQGMIRANHRNEHDHFLRMIYDAPTVDAVPVVRCKDCKRYHPQNISGHWEHKKPFCMRTVTVKMNPDDFCSYGERREGNVEQIT